MSFKLWLCADGLYEVPCSRVAHTFRRVNPSRSSIKDDFLARNFKRLAEVWLDKYKEAVYARDPERYAKVDAGDLSRVKAVKNRLKCKPFKYFLTKVAPEILTRYPIEINAPTFASGQIKSLSHPNVCFDTTMDVEYMKVFLYECGELDNNGKPQVTQFFRLTVFKNINYGYQEFCLDTYKVRLPECHYEEFGNQIWNYDYHKNIIWNANDFGEHFCLTGNFSNQEIYLMKCEDDNQDQKWKFTIENVKLLDRWDEIQGYDKLVYKNGVYKKDKMEPMSDEKLWKCQ